MTKLCSLELPRGNSVFVAMIMKKRKMPAQFTFSMIPCVNIIAVEEVVLMKEVFTNVGGNLAGCLCTNMFVPLSPLVFK